MERERKREMETSVTFPSKKKKVNARKVCTSEKLENFISKPGKRKIIENVRQL
jgi:hypothetical protein